MYNKTIIRFGIVIKVSVRAVSAEDEENLQLAAEWNNEIQLSEFRFKLSPGFHSFFMKKLRKLS